METRTKVISLLGGGALALTGGGLAQAGPAEVSAQPPLMARPATSPDQAGARTSSSQGAREPRRALAEFPGGAGLSKASSVILKLGSGAQRVSVTFKVGEVTGGVDSASAQEAVSMLNEHFKNELTRSERTQAKITRIVVVDPTASEAELKASAFNSGAGKDPAVEITNIPSVSHNPEPADVWPSDIAPRNTGGVTNTPISGKLTDTFTLTGYLKTVHTFTGLGMYGVDDSGRPVYAYEHDYKVPNSYSARGENYKWSTNLPKAYQDTRASDSPFVADLTIGTGATNELRSSTTYTISTWSQPPSLGAKSTGVAHLVGERLGISRKVPGCGGSEVGPWCVNVPGSPTSFPGNVYINMNGFTVNRASCYTYTLGKGGSWCG